MSKYLLMYKSPDGYNMADVPKEQIVRSMQVWGEWLGSMGPKVVDKGDLFKSDVKSVGKDGAKKSDSNLSGYSIIEAANFDEALEAAEGCPIIEYGGRVEVYEAFGL